MNLQNRFFSCVIGVLCITLIGCGESGEITNSNLSPTTRATIAVLGQADFVPDRNADRAGDTVGLPEVLSTRIIEHLTNNKRFTPVERTVLRRVILEQRFGQNIASTYLDNTLDKVISSMESVEADTVGVTGELANYNDLLKDFQELGSAVGADYLVFGNLEKLAHSSSSTEVPYSTSGRAVNENTVDGRLQLRVIDVATGTILGATSVRTRLSETIFEGKQSDTDQYTFYDHLGKLAATKILDVTYPARIVSTEPLVISRGLIDGVKNGDIFTLNREGKEITDGSGQVITRLTSAVGSVKIIDAQNIVSVVESFSGEAPSINDLANPETSSSDSVAAVARSAAVPLTQRNGGELPRLAVGLVRSGSTAKTGEDAQKHTPIFTDSIISRLSQTKRFQLIDRQEVDQLLDEQLAQALSENREMPSAMGTLNGADYLAYGSLDSSSFTSETETIQLPNSSRTFQQTKWYVSGNMRIVDARSGDILESRKISIEESPPGSMDKRRVLTTLADAYAEQVVLMLMNAIYPIKVAAIGQDNSVYVNRGTDGGLANGEILDAFRPGKAVIDPDTGVQLGVEEVMLGQVSLTEVEDARSKGMVFDGVSLKTGDILKRTNENRNKRSEEAQQRAGADTRSGAQLAGTPSKATGKDNKFTLAVGLLKVNASARTTGLSEGHVKRMTDDLMLKLTNTNRFRVLERQEVDQILDEKAFEAATSGGDIISRLREMLGADYLVHGEIANFYINTETKNVPYLNEKETNATAVAEGMLRMVDVHTGAVVGADKVRYSRSVNNVQDTTQLMSDLMDQFTTESVAAIVLRLFPIKVLGVTGDGTIFVNRGADAGLALGAQFSVMRPGAELIDPDTGLSFGSAETEIAQVEITSVEASRARARLVTGEAVMVGDILRVAPPVASLPEPKVRTPDF
ncbi:CsgG/HfaB family protein [Pseudomonadota bacterium]